MGQTTRLGTQIQDFWPDDTDTDMYIPDGSSLMYIMELCLIKWPGCDTANVYISSEHIHTHCIYYDTYDSSDYTDFVHIYYKGN